LIADIFGFKSDTEIIKNPLPVRQGTRKTIAVSVAHTVAGDAVSILRTRTLKFSTFPKFAPSTDTTEPPDAAIAVGAINDVTGACGTASNVSDARALNAMLNEN
jgi:hypothetical protein